MGRREEKISDPLLITWPMMALHARDGFAHTFLIVLFINIMCDGSISLPGFRRTYCIASFFYILRWPLDPWHCHVNALSFQLHRFIIHASGLLLTGIGNKWRRVDYRHFHRVVSFRKPFYYVHGCLISLY